MFRSMIFSCILSLVATTVFAAQYIKPDVLKEKLNQHEFILIVDIQVQSEFAAHHFPNSIQTNAYPVKTEEDRQKLSAILPAINKSNAPVVIVCPRGKGGAMNSYDYLKSVGVPEERLFILEGGMAGWPYKELLEKQ